MGDRDVLKEEAEQRTTPHPLISSPEPQVELNIGSSSDDAQPKLGCFFFSTGDNIHAEDRPAVTTGHNRWPSERSVKSKRTLSE